MGQLTFIQQTVDFSHTTPDGCTHIFKAPAYYRGLDTETAHVVFIDGTAECTCGSEPHIVENGFAQIPYAKTAQMSGDNYVAHDHINLARRHEAGGTII